MSGTAHLYAAVNAAENLIALSEARNGWTFRHDDFVLADAGNRGCRVVTARPSPDPDAAVQRMLELAADRFAGRKLVVEDSFGTLPLEQYGFTPFARMPVMVREPAPAPALDGAVEIVAARTDTDTDDVERLMVEGLGMRGLAPWRRGVLFPAAPAAIPGWVMWLARLGHTPVGTCATFDDGRSVGLYGMAVDEGYRRKGIGRALLAATLAGTAATSTPGTLTATDEGFRLYASAGFRTVGQAAWWRREPAP